jgi:hypothetical protein
MAKAVESISKVSDFRQALPQAPFEEEMDGNDEVGSSNNAIISLGEKPYEMNAEGIDTSELNPAAAHSEHVGSSDRVVVEADAVQVSAMDVDVVPSTAAVAVVEADAANYEADEGKKARALALDEKSKRQKAREDAIAAFCIKNQLRSVVASFEQDNVSQAVEASLVPKIPGLGFPQTRCRGSTCDFCGLSDTALGTNFVRVPNEKEWNELILHATKSRQTHLVADLRDQGEKTPLNKSQTRKLMKITIRLGDDLFSNDSDELYFSGISDGGMLEFLPRNPDGFQDELLFRYNAGLPFISGSMTSHEGCGVAAHNARKIKMIEMFKEQRALVVEREAGITCGRTLEIGADSAGRSYWHFNNDLGSLFVCTPIPGKNSRWQRFSGHETISSVIVSLGKDPVASELKRTFPEAAALIRSGKWSELLVKRFFKSHESEGRPTSAEKMEEGSNVDKSLDMEEPSENGAKGMEMEEPTDKGEVSIPFLLFPLSEEFYFCSSNLVCIFHAAV